MNNIHDFSLYFGDTPEEIKSERKTSSRILMFLTIAAVASYLTVFGIQLVIFMFFPQLIYNSWLSMSLNDFYSIVVALLFVLFTLKLPKMKPVAMTNMSFGSFWCFVCAAVSVMMAGSVIGNVLSEMIGSLFKIEMQNSVSEMVSSISTVETFVFVVILAPIIEEYIFRNLLIDRLSRYGTVFSVVISAVMFGLFHGNFYQFFYAAGMGILLGYMYCIFGKLRYSILLHMIVNFMGSVVVKYIAEFAENENVIKQAVVSIYSMSYMAAAVFGVFVLVRGIRNSKAYIVDGVLVKPFGILKKNLGFILFLAYSLIMFMMNIFL